MAISYLDGSESYHVFEYRPNEDESFMYGTMPRCVIDSLWEHLHEKKDDVPLQMLMDLNHYRFALLLNPSEMKVVVVVTRFGTSNFNAALNLESEEYILLATDLTGDNFGMTDC